MIENSERSSNRNGLLRNSLKRRVAAWIVVAGVTLLQAPSCDTSLLAYRAALAIRSLLVNLLGIAIDNAVFNN
ncbi:MAG: hypothetical protein U1D55_15355 [Phycisphaerae bacterium]